jgi:hypothetical protein
MTDARHSDHPYRVITRCQPVWMGGPRPTVFDGARSGVSTVCNAPDGAPPAVVDKLAGGASRRSGNHE